MRDYPPEKQALRALLELLITEQSEGEWDDKTIQKDVGRFTDAIWPVMTVTTTDRRK